MPEMIVPPKESVEKAVDRFPQVEHVRPLLSLSNAFSVEELKGISPTLNPRWGIPSHLCDGMEN